MSHYLSEAFKKLDVLNEDTFAINTNGLEDFVKFEDADELEDSIDVIDTEAETIDDLQDSYVGKVILDCCVCHSKLYKDVEDVVIEDDIANANEECPFCYTTDGYKVIGQVATFGEEEKEEVEETKTEEPEEVEEKEEKELEEGLFGIKTKKEKEKEAKAKAQKEAQKQRDKELKDQEEKARQQSVADSWARRDKAERDAKAEYNRTRTTTQGSKVSNTGKAGVYYSGGDYYSEELNESKSIKEDTNDWSLGLSIRFVFGWGGTDNEVICYTRNYHYDRNDDKFTLKARLQLDTGELIVNRVSRYLKKVPATDMDLKAAGVSRERLIQAMKNFANKDVYESKSIKESVNNINVETDNDIINVTPDDNGKVTVTTAPKVTSVESEEVITPIEPEVQSEINDNVEDGGEIEIDMDEFDEESFDELGEGYLKKVYENVNSFKTSNVSFIKNKLIVEGIIKFNSGKSKKTNFIFESREATKSGKVRFIGENKEIARGRKSFTVTGRVDNKKFLSESLNYNYGVRGANGKAQRLYGTVRKGN